jgi:uncharacterized protein (DUF2235 family)
MQEVPRQIVLCLDGTSNTLTGRQRDTNVLRLFEHLARAQDPQQLLYYDPGVGSPDALPTTGLLDWWSRKWERVAGLAYGRGIYDNVAQAYAFLMRHWRPGDQVFVFGFSRGAFTARCVAGMVNLFGILKPEHESLLDTLMRVYFAPVGGQVQLEVRQRGAKALLGLEREANNARTRDEIAQQVRQSFASAQGREAWVHFVGVWDTVASVGLPGLSVRISSSATVSGKRVRHVRHALSLDEHRLPFEPRLYTEADFGDAQGAQSLRQRWFRGVHGDVGGGYAPKESGLSDEALRWIAIESTGCGLRSAPVVEGRAETLVHDPVHTVPWWTLAGLTVRDSTGGAARLKAIADACVVRPGVPAASVWTGPLRSPLALLFAALGALVGALWHGSLLRGDWRAWREPLAALQAGSAMAEAQARSLVAVPLGDWRALWAGVPHDGSLGWAFAFDLLLIASYAYLLARWLSWGFTRLAGWRLPNQPLPAWRWLGLSLAFTVGGDAFENVMTLIALDGSAPVHAWQALVLWLGSLGSLAKWVGLAGCLLTGLLGAFARRSTARTHVPIAGG